MNASIAASAMSRRVIELQRLEQVDLLVADLEAAAREVVAAAPADQAERDLASGVLGDERAGAP